MAALPDPSRTGQLRVLIGRASPKHVGSAPWSLLDRDEDRLVVVVEVHRIDRVPVCDGQDPSLPGALAGDGECERRNGDGPKVEEDVIVGAQAQEVCKRISTVMRPTQRADVCRLRVRPAGCHQRNVADLARVLVHLLDLAGDSGVSDDAQNRLGDAFGWLTRIPDDEYTLDEDPAQFVTPADEAVREPLAEAPVDGVEAVVPKPTSGLADDPDRDAQVTILEQSDVSAREGLVGDGTRGAGFQSALTGVDDDVALVIVWIHPREDHRGRRRPRSIVDPRLEWTVEARCTQGCTVAEHGSERNPEDLTERWWRSHERHPRIRSVLRGVDGVGSRLRNSATCRVEHLGTNVCVDPGVQ